MHGYAAENKIHYRDNADLITSQKVIELFQQETTRLNAQLGQTEQIKRFRLVPEEWNPQNGMLSPTLKLKRRVVSEKYMTIIKSIYASQKNKEVQEEVKVG